MKEIINELIQIHHFQSYLEIGLGDGKNFDGVECNLKIGVDPKSDSIPIFTGITKPQDSDTFFEWYLKEVKKSPSDKFDLIFIDGLHHADQVERDILNSWKCLNAGGMILIHDVKPSNKAMTCVPRGNQKEWTGDVFQAWHGLNETYPNLNTEYIDDPYGVGVIHKSRHRINPGFVSDISFEWYFENQLWQPKR